MMGGFWTNPDSTFWLVVDRVAILLSYVALLTITAAATQWWQSVRRQERRSRRTPELADGRVTKPVAVLVSPPAGSVEADVERYLVRTFPDWAFPYLPLGADDPGGEPRRCPIVHFEHGEQMATPEGVDADLERLRRAEGWLKDEGFSEVHLFMRSTVAFGTAVGCLFANWGAVHVYHWNQRTSTYEYWFPLAEVKRLGATPNFGDAMASLAARILARRRDRQAARSALAASDAESEAGD
jgi:hypothetical protein